MNGETTATLGQEPTMTHLLRKTSILLGLLGATLPGCIGDEVPLGSDAAANAATRLPVDVVDGYGYCSPNLRSMGCTRTGPSASGIDVPDGVLGTAGDGSDCYCPRECGTASDCPVPDTGTSLPVCGRLSDFASCLLPCDDGQVCPDGMTCRTTFDTDQAVCDWFTPTADQILEKPAACRERTTREDCEAVLADAPVHPDYHCAWATERIVPRDDLTCTSLEAVGRCIAVTGVEPAGAACGAAPSCDGAGSSPVYYAELGAGDISLLTLDDCDHLPWSMGLDPAYASCTFASDPALPSVCDCACLPE
jgi:hypothetical protein